MSKSKHVGISRINSRNTIGWFARVYFDGGVRSKFYADKKHGGTDKALALAKQWRQEQAGQYAEMKRPFYAKPQSHNTTGYNGVSETFQRNRKGEKVPCFDVFWAPEPGKAKHKRFYFHHYPSGREAALKDAIKFRKEKEAEILKRRLGEEEISEG